MPASAEPARRRTAAVALGAGALLAVAGCGGAGGVDVAAPDEGKLAVVATTDLVADWAGQVGGDRVSVGQLLDPLVDPHEFEPTPPLPTYLVALAVGDFDVVEGEKVSGGKVPFRIIAPRGKGHLAGFALDKTPRHLAALEEWFGTPYPFAKLDLVAVPSFSSSGMENAGLITFREALLLMDGDKAAIAERLWCEGVIAHELAHMWFGDLVTMAWWDDVWLNEAFATWMGRKSMAVVSPELDIYEQARAPLVGTTDGRLVLYKDGAAIIKRYKLADFEVVWVDDKNELHMTPGIEKELQLKKRPTAGP